MPITNQWWWTRYLCKYQIRLRKSSLRKFHFLFFLAGLWKTILPNPFAGRQGHVTSSGQWDLGRKAICHFWAMVVEILFVILQIRSFLALANLMWRCWGADQSGSWLTTWRTVPLPSPILHPYDLHQNSWAITSGYHLGCIMGSGSQSIFVFSMTVPE